MARRSPATIWLEADFARKKWEQRHNPSERELFQLIDSHYDWCKCQIDGTFNSKATSFVTFDYDDSPDMEDWEIGPDEVPPKWIA
jgi:hypothetical protein